MNLHAAISFEHLKHLKPLEKIKGDHHKLWKSFKERPPAVCIISPVASSNNMQIIIMLISHWILVSIIIQCQRKITQHTESELMHNNIKVISNA